MSDTEKATPNKTGASGAPWTDAEKIAYLLILCEHEGRVDTKIASAPIPVNRSLVSCKKLLVRLKEKHKDDIAAIKAGEAIATTIETAAAGDKDKVKTPRKRKGKAVEQGNEEETPTKKLRGRKKEVKDEFKEEVNEEVREEAVDDTKMEEEGEDLVV